MVAGQYPKREWKDNPDGQIRTIEEMVRIAKKHGVIIPDDLDFHIDESGELNRDLFHGTIGEQLVSVYFMK